LAAGVIAWGGRSEDWKQKAAVDQLDVPKPGQKVGQHDLPPIGVSSGKPLANLWNRKKDDTEIRITSVDASISVLHDYQRQKGILNLIVTGTLILDSKYTELNMSYPLAS